MATAAQLPPPPDGQDPSAQGAPSSPQAASPSPPQPSPTMQQGTQDAIQVVSKLRSIAKTYPGTAPLITQINDLMRQVVAKMMESQKPGEPQAPPA